MPSYELQKLLNHYGVTNATMPSYGGATKPIDPAAANYQALMDKYTADNSQYTDWANQYNNRLQSTSMYGPGYQGDPLQALSYKYGYQAPTTPTTPTTSITPTPITTPVAEPKGGGGKGGGGGVANVNTSVGDPNSLTGGFLNNIIGQDPTNVPVVDLSTQSAALQAQRAAEAQAMAAAQESFRAQELADQKAADEAANAERDTGGVGGFDSKGFQGAVNEGNNSKSYGGGGGGGYGGSQGGGGFGGRGAGSDSSGGGMCVDPATLILLSNLTNKPAGELIVGDILYTMHEETMQWGDYPVSATSIVEEPRCLVRFDNDKIIIASLSHKFMLEDWTWATVQELEPGDMVTGVKESSRVVSVKNIGVGAVVKLTVEDAHTYVSNGLVSHNKFARGGLVELHQKYADGGEVQDFGGYGNDPAVPMAAAPSPGANVEGNLGLDVSRLTPAQAQFLAQQDPQAMARGVERFNQSAPQEETLPQMAAAYSTPEMAQYAQEYQDARRQAAVDRANFEKVLQSQLTRNNNVAPDKSELYFRLAAAFGAPTKTGGFAESMGNAGSVLGDNQKAIREANLADQMRKDAMALKIAEYHASGSKEDLRDLRTLAVEEQKARRIALEPKSEYGKEALDLHFTPGTPEYVAYVNGRAKQDQARKEAVVATGQANSKLAAQRLTDAEKNAAMLTPAEATALGKEQTALDAKMSLLKSLEKAYALSGQALSGSGIDKAKGFLGGLTGSTATSVVAKENLDQLLNQAALDYAARLKPMSDTDLLFAQKLTGLAGTSKASRASQIENLFGQTRDEIEQHKARIGKIKSRENRTQSPGATVAIPVESIDTTPAGE